MAAKKSKHPLAVSMREAQQRIADTIATRIETDASTAYTSIMTLAQTGDVNGTRLQAARTVLEIAGVLGGKTSVRATAENEPGGKMTIEVVHVKNPPAEDD